MALLCECAKPCRYVVPGRPPCVAVNILTIFYLYYIWVSFDNKYYEYSALNISSRAYLDLQSDILPSMQALYSFI